MAAEFKGTCRELMRIDFVSGIHGVQEIIFNPLAKPGDDEYGNLYIGVGDGGSAENGYSFLTHHPYKIWGSILRINPMGKNSTNGQYGIPNQNPFHKKIRIPITIREIYADGFRNPNGITWTSNGQMLATNIGQANIEAIDIIIKGHDYGWPVREGRFAVHPEGDINKIYPLPANDSAFHFTYPVAAFDHDEGNAIEGGFEYEGKAIPELGGNIYLEISYRKVVLYKFIRFKFWSPCEYKRMVCFSEWQKINSPGYLRTKSRRPSIRQR